MNTIGVPAVSHATSSQKKRLGKERGQGRPRAKDLPEARTLMMMKISNDDDDFYTESQ